MRSPDDTEIFHTSVGIAFSTLEANRYPLLIAYETGPVEGISVETVTRNRGFLFRTFRPFVAL
jgi:hypothetical protein